MSFRLRQAPNGDLWLFFDPEFHGGANGFAAKVEGGVWHPQGLLPADSSLAKEIRTWPVVECGVVRVAATAREALKDTLSRQAARGDKGAAEVLQDMDMEDQDAAAARPPQNRRRSRDPSSS